MILVLFLPLHDTAKQLLRRAARAGYSLQRRGCASKPCRLLTSPLNFLGTFPCPELGKHLPVEGGVFVLPGDLKLAH